MKKALVLLSGGLDSAAALYWALNEGFNVSAISFNFYMRSPHEIAAVKELTKKTKVKLFEVAIPFIKEASNLVEDHLNLPYGTNFPEGYVPIRNLLFYTISAYYAEAYAIPTIIGGHLSTDAHAFPDASPNFFQTLQKLINTTTIPSNPQKIEYLMPFTNKSKADVLRLALKLGVPLDLTWSCYWENDIPCKLCVACNERQQAFNELGIEDRLKKHLKPDKK